METGPLVAQARELVAPEAGTPYAMRYHAALQVSVRVVQPLPRPDPWKHSIGGPGGPQYPIGGDEYGVSL